MLERSVGRSRCCCAPGRVSCKSPTSEKSQRFELPKPLKYTDTTQLEKRHMRWRRLSWRAIWGLSMGRTRWSRNNKSNDARISPHPQLLQALPAPCRSSLEQAGSHGGQMEHISSCLLDQKLWGSMWEDQEGLSDILQQRNCLVRHSVGAGGIRVKTSWELARCVWFESGWIESSPRMKVSLYLVTKPAGVSGCYLFLLLTCPVLPSRLAQ